MQQRELPAAIPMPITETLAAIPLENAAREPGRPVYLRRTDGGWQDVTAAQFLDEVRAAARGLVADQASAVGGAAPAPRRDGFSAWPRNTSALSKAEAVNANAAAKSLSDSWRAAAWLR